MDTLDQNEMRSLTAAGGVIILSIAAILAFVYQGGGTLFYAIAIIAILLGFYMAYRISKESRPAQKAKRRTR